MCYLSFVLDPCLSSWLHQHIFTYFYMLPRLPRSGFAQPGRVTTDWPDAVNARVKLTRVGGLANPVNDPSGPRGYPDYNTPETNLEIINNKT